MRIDYDGRRFRPADEPAAHGRIARYHQRGDLLWGEFSGGQARYGALAGLAAADGSLDFAYSFVTDAGQIVAGRCRSTPTLLADGRIQLAERWERYGEHPGSGMSSLLELTPEEPSPHELTAQEQR